MSQDKPNYIGAGLTVLAELGTVSTKTLVIAAKERGLVGDGKWVYHNFSRALRDSPLFDTSKRGHISLAPEGDEGTVLQEDEPTTDEPVVVNNPPQFEEPGNPGVDGTDTLTTAEESLSEIEMEEIVEGVKEILENPDINPLEPVD